MSYDEPDETFTVEDEPDRTIPEDTFVKGRLVDLKREHVVPKDVTKEPFDKLIWWFEVTQGGLYLGRKIKGQTGVKFSNHPNNRARHWAEALLQRELGVDAALSRQDLLQLPCEFTVRHERDRQDAQKIWERIDEVVPSSIAAQADEPPF